MNLTKRESVELKGPFLNMPHMAFFQVLTNTTNLKRIPEYLTMIKHFLHQSIGELLKERVHFHKVKAKRCTNLIRIQTDMYTIKTK